MICNRRDNRAKRGGLLLVLSVLPLLVLGYALSIGPAARLHAYGHFEDVPAVYVPVLAACRENLPGTSAVSWYVDQWLPDGWFFSNGEFWHIACEGKIEPFEPIKCFFDSDHETETPFQECVIDP